MSELVLFLDNENVSVYFDGDYINLSSSKSLIFKEERMAEFVDDIQLLSGFSGNSVKIFYEGKSIVHEVVQAPFTKKKKDLKSFVKRKVENGLSERLSFSKFQYGFQYFDNEKSGATVSIDIIDKLFTTSLLNAFLKKNIRVTFLGSFGALLYHFQNINKDIQSSPKIIMLYQNENSPSTFIYTGGHDQPYFIRYTNKYTSIESAYRECFSRAVQFGKQRFSNYSESTSCIGEATGNFKNIHKDNTIEHDDISMGVFLASALLIPNDCSDLLSSDEKISGMQRKIAALISTIVFIVFVCAVLIEIFSFIDKTGNIDNIDDYMKTENEIFQSLSSEREYIINNFEKTKIISRSQDLDAYYILNIISDNLLDKISLTKYVSSKSKEYETNIVVSGMVFYNTSKSYEEISSLIDRLEKNKMVSFKFSDSWSRKWIQLTYKIKRPKNTGIPFVLKGTVITHE